MNGLTLIDNPDSVHVRPPRLPDLSDQLTVAAWFELHDGRGETIQAVVSQWRPPDEWPGFAAFDAEKTDRLPCRGYFGAITVGRYVYFVPEQYGETGKPTHGVVLRFDTNGDFFAPESYRAYDASATDGLDCRGYYGAVTDGRYVYFVPRQLNCDRYHGHVLRLDTNGDFKHPSSWAAFSINEEQSHQGGVFDGRYVYFCPGFRGDPKREDKVSSRVVRYDTRADFKSLSSYQTIDISQFHGPRAGGFDGGVFDGRYLYLVPLDSGLTVRYDTRQGFTEKKAWQAYDARPHGFKQAVGAVFDGTWVYYCAYGHGVIVRFNTQRDFNDSGAWQKYDAGLTDDLVTTGFDGGFFDGRFVYFQPFFYKTGPEKRANKFHSHYLRYNVTLPFDEPAAWQAYDASQTDGLPSVGYNGGAFDGRYFYAAPWQQGRKAEQPEEFITHGKVLRCDTLGDNGGFSLRACDCGHNGGLNAAILGPTFMINTEQGCFRVSTPRLLPAGRHHLIGTYDGEVIKLYVNGIQVAERPARGQIVKSGLPLTVGRIQDGGGALRGRVLFASVSPHAITPTEAISIAHTHLYQEKIETTFRFELEGYYILDQRKKLPGTLYQPRNGAGWARLTATDRNTGELCWHHTITLKKEQSQAEFEIPTENLKGGYYLVEATDSHGRRYQLNLAVRQDRKIACKPSQKKEKIDYLSEVKTAVDQIISRQTRRLRGDPDGVPFVTVSRKTGVSHLSLGAKNGDSFTSYWFPEESFEYDTFRADHSIWPVLDKLTEQTGDRRYRELTENMINAFAEYGFDANSGLIHFSEEADFDVSRSGPCSKRMASDLPKFKAINSGLSNDMHIERFWEKLPEQTHRWLRATFYALVTDPRRMDYNRFCPYAFEDKLKKPALTANSGHCGFETAAASLILFWASCWTYAEDRECLDWATRMTAKWAAVQNPQSGLVPDFFGASAWQPGGVQQPGNWCKSPSGAMAALQWLRAATMLRRRSGAEKLADQLHDMGRRLALGIAKFAYDRDQRMFYPNLHLDGRPYQETARYCFFTQAEKDEAVLNNPQLQKVPVYSGTGLYRQPNYYEYYAGSIIPCSLAETVAFDPAPELVERLREIAADTVEEAEKISGPFTPEGRWTFRASGWYVQTCLKLYKQTGDPVHLRQARRLADREVLALRQARYPEWWRERQRSIWLQALLDLHQELDNYPESVKKLLKSL